MMKTVLDSSALDMLLDVIGGDPAALVELIDSFEAEAPALLQAMQAASASGELDDFRRAAHSLKSGARDFGAGELSALCASAEQHCREGDLTAAARLLAAIAEACPAAMSALADYKRSLC